MNPETNRGGKTDKGGKIGGRGTDANRDPISKKPGAHPVGTGVGAAVGGAAGIAGAGAIAAGTSAGAVLGGPAGAVAGAAVGAVVGGLAGKAVAEKIDPTVEDEYWRSAYQKEPYFLESYTFEDYAPAYRTGYEGYAQYNARSFEDAERDLEVDYNSRRGTSRLSWEHAKQATKSAWDRVSGGRKDDDLNH